MGNPVTVTGMEQLKTVPRYIALKPIPDKKEFGYGKVHGW
jgi:hypothetical protein